MIVFSRFIFMLWCLAGMLVPAWADYVVARDTPSWFKASFLDIPEDVSEATDAGKRVMIYLGQDGCPYCEKLHQESFKQSDVVHKLTTNFDSLAINIFGDADVVWTDGDDYTEKTLAQKLGIQFTPSLMFLNEEGEVVLLIKGYQPPEKFSAILDFIIDKREDEDFSEYMRKHPSNTYESSAVSDYPDEFMPPPFALGAAEKKTAILVLQDNCRYCDEWRDFLTGDDASEWREKMNFIQFKTHNRDKTIDKQISEKEWVESNDITFIPSLVFLDPQGNEIFRADGYLRSFHLASIVDYIASDAYRTQPEFQRFLQARSDAIRARGGEVSIW